MLEEYQNSQPIVYKMLVNSVCKNRFSHAYLFETNCYPRQLDLALSFAKFLLCPSHFTTKKECGDCTQCFRIEQNAFSELKIIRPDGQWIKKEQLELLQSEFGKKAVEASQKVYIITEADKLNASSANSILKFLEEPEENIVAILLTDHRSQLLETIVSRCQLIPFARLTSEQLADQSPSLNKMLLHLAPILMEEESNLEDFMANGQSLQMVEKIIKFIHYLEEHSLETLLQVQKLWHEEFKDKETVAQALEIMILYYQDVIHVSLHQPLTIFQDDEEMIQKIALRNGRDRLCHKIDVLLHLKETIKYNINLSLLMDKLIITFGKEDGSC